MANRIRVRAIHLRLLPVVYALGYLTIVTDQLGTPITDLVDWSVVVTAAAVSFGGGRQPLPTLLAQCVLMALASLYGQQAGMEAAFTFLVVAEVELAARRDGTPIVVGSVAATTVTVLAAGRWHVTLITLPFVLMVVCMVLAMLVVGRYVRSTRRTAELARDRAVQLETQRHVLDTAVRATERAAIARELHDILAHHVSAIAVRASGAQYGATPEMAEVLRDVHTAACTALTQLQQLVAILRDADAGERDIATLLIAPTGLTAALDELVEWAGKHTELSVRITGCLDGLDPAHGFAVMRVAQEALTNVVKHSPVGSRTTLTVDATSPATIVVRVDTVNPSGVGPKTPVSSSPGGWGLAGMRERVELLGGVLHAGRTDAGWLVEASLPCLVSG